MRLEAAEAQLCAEVGRAEHLEHQLSEVTQHAQQLSWRLEELEAAVGRLLGSG